MKRAIIAERARMSKTPRDPGSAPTSKRKAEARKFRRRVNAFAPRAARPPLRSVAVPLAAHATRRALLAPRGARQATRRSSQPVLRYPRRLGRFAAWLPQTSRYV